MSFLQTFNIGIKWLSTPRETHQMVVVYPMTEMDEQSGPPITLIDPIDMSKLDTKFREQIKSMPNSEELYACFACSTCTAACPIANIWQYKPHQLIRMIILGMKEEVLSSNEIWLCLTCFQCQERCPQKVRVTDIFFDCKNLAAEEGKVPPNIIGLGKELLEKGQLYTVTADWEREDLGLEPAVPGLSVDAMKNVLKETRTNRLVEGGE
jgi:heterodisulfide reductase subunit C